MAGEAPRRRNAVGTIREAKDLGVVPGAADSISKARFGGGYRSAPGSSNIVKGKKARIRGDY